MNKTPRARFAVAALVSAAIASLAGAAGASAANAPSIESESVSHLTSSDATLEANINPQEATPGAVYQFQLVQEPDEYATEILCPPHSSGFSVCVGTHSASALPIGLIMHGSGGVSVSLDLSSAGVSLQPETTYHYRVLAAHRIMTEDTLEWEEPPTNGADQSFTTPPAGAGRPSEVVVEPAEPGTDGFKMEGKLNPNNLPTSYYFMYREASAVECEDLEGCGMRTAEGGTLNGDVQQEVSPSEATDLIPGETYVYWLIAKNAGGTVRGRNTLEFTGRNSYRPSIASESASGITEHDATLEAQIDPDGAKTTYEFYLEAPSCQTYGPGHCEAGGGVPIAAGSVPEGTGPQRVSVDVQGAWGTLSAATAYGYRVVATNSVGETLGQEKVFTTPPAMAPMIESESISHLSASDATLEAQINTEGLQTSYQFRLESGCLPPLACLAIAVHPLPSGELLGSFLAQNVSIDLNSAGVTLHPGIRYRYSVEATNGAGTTQGAGHTFTAPPVAPSVFTPPNTGGSPPRLGGAPPTGLSQQKRRHRRRHRRRHHASPNRSSRPG